MSLPAYVARCRGIGIPRTSSMENMLADGGYNYLQCQEGERRSLENYKQQVWFISVPEFIDGQCPVRIPRGEPRHA